MSHDILYDGVEEVEVMSEQEREATQHITQEVLAQLAEAVGVEVPLAELLAGGVTQKTLSYRVDTFQRYLVDHFLNSVQSKRIP